MNKKHWKETLFVLAFAILIFYFIHGIRDEQCQIGLRQYHQLVEPCDKNASCPKDIAYLRARAEAVRSIGYCRPQ